MRAETTLQFGESGQGLIAVQAIQGEGPARRLDDLVPIRGRFQTGELSLVVEGLSVGLGEIDRPALRGLLASLLFFFFCFHAVFEALDASLEVSEIGVVMQSAGNQVQLVACLPQVTGGESSFAFAQEIGALRL